MESEEQKVQAPEARDDEANPKQENKIKKKTLCVMNYTGAKVYLSNDVSKKKYG